MSAQEEPNDDAAFDRAKLPMLLAAVGVVGGLAIAGSVERTAGGAIVLAAWMIGIVALHRLGRAGSLGGRLQASGLRPQAGDESRPQAGDDAGDDAKDDAKT